MISPYTLVFAIAENAFVNGAEFRLGTEVTGIALGDADWVEHTTGGEVRARCVVNAAGTHANELNNMVSASKLKIIPRHGKNVLLDRNFIDKVTTIIIETPHDLPGGRPTKGMGIMPTVDGTVVLGCDTQHLGDRDKTPSTACGMGDITNFFKRVWHPVSLRRRVYLDT